MLNLAYQSIPPALWSAPEPDVAFAADWNFTFHSLRRLLPLCVRSLRMRREPLSCAPTVTIRSKRGRLLYEKGAKP